MDCVRDMHTRNEIQSGINLHTFISLLPSLPSSLPPISPQEAGDRALVDRKHVTERGVLILALVFYGLATALVASTLEHRLGGGEGGREGGREGEREEEALCRQSTFK